MSERRSPSSVPSSSNRPNSTPQGDPLKYLRAVKAAFDENSAEYQNFLEIMKDVKNETCSTEDVVRRVIRLFRSHRNLVLGFRQFLPPNFHITLTPETRAVNLELALGFLMKVKDRFIDDTPVYATFLTIMASFKHGQRETRDVIHEVQQLFQNHPDLLDDFYQFLPPEQAENEPNGNAGSTSESASPSAEPNSNTDYPTAANDNAGSTPEPASPPVDPNGNAGSIPGPSSPPPEQVRFSRGYFTSQKRLEGVQAGLATATVTSVFLTNGVRTRADCLGTLLHRQFINFG